MNEWLLSIRWMNITDETIIHLNHGTMDVLSYFHRFTKNWRLLFQLGSNFPFQYKFHSLFHSINNLHNQQKVQSVANLHCNLKLLLDFCLFNILCPANSCDDISLWMHVLCTCKTVLMWPSSSISSNSTKFFLGYTFLKYHSSFV